MSHIITISRFTRTVVEFPTNVLLHHSAELCLGPIAVPHECRVQGISVATERPNGSLERLNEE